MAEQRRGTAQSFLLCDEREAYQAAVARYGDRDRVRVAAGGGPFLDNGRPAADVDRELADPEQDAG